MSDITFNSRTDVVKRLKRAVVTMVWLTLVTFPLMVMKNNTAQDYMEWRWVNLIFMFPGFFLLSYVWFYFIDRKNSGVSGAGPVKVLQERVVKLYSEPRIKTSTWIVFAVMLVLFPLLGSAYNTGVMATAFIYIILALGLNIIIGWGGLLNLGYAAFFAIGAYTYALLNHYAGVGFWIALPLGGIVAAIFGVLLGIPVLRLRGDYLAIVTLGFGEIVKIVLNNLGDLTGGPDGISHIDRPALFGIDLHLRGNLIYIYFIALAAVILTIFIMRRIENSRWGRAWEAMREDEVAAESMGVDITQAKITTFALGSFFAGIAGVILAAKTTKVTPESFALMESVMVLSAVILGGKGSIPGVIVGALVLKLMPEYFRFLSQYRMLIFGLVLVVMMVFKPEGIIPKVRKRFVLKKSPETAEGEATE